MTKKYLDTPWSRAVFHGLGGMGESTAYIDILDDSVLPQ
uniref:Uncharacterized protein n=1 Tax=Anguilla anguilla TaxID=7936 RepID=A0A0E9R8G9_ANGAN